MSRLIDADALYEKTAEWEAQALSQVERYNPTDSLEEWRRWSYVLKERSAFKFDVADAPTIDAVEVVRCKDCKHLKLTGGRESTGEGIYTCDVWKRRTFNGTGYCSYAERRSDE